MAKTLSLTGDIKLLDSSTEILTQALSASVNYTEVTVQDVTVAASASDMAINFAGVSTAQLVMLVPTYNSSSTEYLQVKVNSGTE